MHARKRQLETSESDPLPAKKIKLTPDAQEPGAGDEEAEKADKVRYHSLTQVNQSLTEMQTLHQSKPKPPKRPYTWLLEGCADAVDAGSPPEPVNTFASE